MRRTAVFAVLALCAALSPALGQVPISALPNATTPLAGTEVIPLVQGGVTSKATVTSVRGSTPAAVTGAVKSNGSGTYSQAACADLSDAAASCATNATNAANISSGTLPVARLPLGTNATVGALRCDGATTTCSGGVVTSVAGGSGTVTSVATGACLTGGPITTTGTVSGSQGFRVVTGTSDTILSSDACKVIKYGNGSTVAVAIPQATGSFGSGFGFEVQNTGAGTITFTPDGGSLVNGGATLTVAQNRGCYLFSDGTDYQVSACTALVSAGTGTVTSVAATVPGGFSISGSPVTTTGTLAIAANGTSGGVVCYTGSTTSASSGALTANLPVIGGGAGVCPGVGTRSGNTTAFVTTTGSQTSGDVVSIDASGNHIASGTALTNLATTNTVQTFTASKRGTVQTLTISTATFTPNFDTGNNFTLTLINASCPCTIANPSTTPVAGQSGIIEIIQSATGSDTIGTWGSQYVAAGGVSTLTLSTAANAKDYASYYVVDATHILVSMGALNASH